MASVDWSVDWHLACALQFSTSSPNKQMWCCSSVRPAHWLCWLHLCNPLPLSSFSLLRGAMWTYIMFVWRKQARKQLETRCIPLPCCTLQVDFSGKLKKRVCSEVHGTTAGLSNILCYSLQWDRSSSSRGGQSSRDFQFLKPSLNFHVKDLVAVGYWLV